ncbi:hypothetical protein J572_3240, partial [Acinetobacter baumannii 1499986]
MMLCMMWKSHVFSLFHSTYRFLSYKILLINTIS